MKMQMRQSELLMRLNGMVGLSLWRNQRALDETEWNGRIFLVEKSKSSGPSSFMYYFMTRSLVIKL